MRAVLVVEPEFCDYQGVLNRFGYECVVLQVSDPLQAVRSMQALQFDLVIVPSARVDEFAYASLFSAMRLIAPTAALQCALPKRSVVPAGADRRAAANADGMSIRMIRQRAVEQSS